jgi:predicted dehydrogenase
MSYQNSGTPVRFGIIGGGLMGRELASALGRWFVLDGVPAAELVAVCDTSEAQREWFRRVPTVAHITDDYRELLESGEVDVVYVAVPHHLHEQIYADVLDGGKDMLAEKPFGINLTAAERLQRKVAESERFVRCSSEFPFFPGALAAYRCCSEQNIGKLLQVNAGFWHSSDLDPNKPINWKRQTQFCGNIGVMGDLGLHVVHIPFRLGWRVSDVHAQLQKVYTERPDGKGGMAACDTWDNAMLNCTLTGDVPARFEMKRLAPGETNTWYFEVLGTEGGVRFSTKEPKTLWTFDRRSGQAWRRIDLGHQANTGVITGGIFEFGFPDAMLQMLAAFVSEREGTLGDRFGCASVEEAVMSHRLFDAALRSHQEKTVIRLNLQGE